MFRARVNRDVSDRGPHESMMLYLTAERRCDACGMAGDDLIKGFDTTVEEDEEWLGGAGAVGAGAGGGQSFTNKRNAVLARLRYRD